MRNYSIGVFDSGFGGLDVLREMVKKLPEYSYIYLGDTARAPYGTCSQELIYTFTKQAVDFLFRNNCWLVILACNTASSGALRRIQREYLPRYYSQRRVLGVIIPACEETVGRARNNRVGIIGTEATVSSGAFERELKKLNPSIEVFQKACPLLVPVVESGEQNSKITELVLEDCLRPIIERDIDTLILGCTHYGLLEDEIRKITGKEIDIVSEGRVIPRKLEDYLMKHPEIEGFLRKESSVRFLTTDPTDKFTKFGSKFFGREIKAEKIGL